MLSSLQIPNDREICVNVQFDREHYVGVVQAVPINVYDYYEPGQSDTSYIRDWSKSMGGGGGRGGPEHLEIWLIKNT